MITISLLAKSTLKNLIKENGKSAYLYLQGGGCSGFNYKFDILQEDRKPNKNDEIVKIDEYNMYICGISMMYILGTHIDYKTDLMGSRFDFTNDKISNKCGCGTSFNFLD